MKSLMGDEEINGVILDGSLSVTCERQWIYDFGFTFYDSCRDKKRDQQLNLINFRLIARLLPRVSLAWKTVCIDR